MGQLLPPWPSDWHFPISRQKPGFNPWPEQHNSSGEINFSSVVTRRYDLNTQPTQKLHLLLPTGSETSRDTETTGPPATQLKRASTHHRGAPEGATPRNDADATGHVT